MLKTNKGGVNMQYVYRMMSRQEYEDLIAGKTLTNTTVHDPAHTFSYSTGFCFLPWEVECTWRKKRITRMTALQAIDRLLPGVNRYDVWVQLKVLNPKVLKKSKGWYADWQAGYEYWATEYCTTSYCAKDLQPMHVFSIQKILDVMWDRFMAN